jgi:hypothetical protein
MKNTDFQPDPPRILLFGSSDSPLWVLFGTSESGEAMRFHQGSKGYPSPLLQFHHLGNRLFFTA